MLITERINNNVAIARTADGRDAVIFGKGVGFPKVPYELEDESVITRTFFDVGDDLASVAGSVDEEIMAATLEILDLATERLRMVGRLNPNLVFTLADHLQFAREREAEGIVIVNPLAEEAALVYPHETEVSREALRILARHGIELPASEAPAIALHFVNAEMEGGNVETNMRYVQKSVRVIDAVVAIVEEEFGIAVDRSSYDFVRFTTHLRYFVRRLMSGDPARSPNKSLFEQVARDFPDVYRCVRRIADHLAQEYGWACSEEEMLYLMMYINRVASS